MLRSPILFIFVLLGLTLACKREQRDIRDFYYPVRGLDEGMVYAFEPLSGPSSEPIYWYLLATKNGEDYLLNTTVYGPDFTPAYLVTEKMTPAGALTTQTFYYATDSTGQSNRAEAEILAGNAFPFTVPVGEEQPAFVHRTRAPRLDVAGGELRLTYNRQYSHDTLIPVLGTELPAVVFAITGETDVREANGESFAPTFEGFEVYAKGIGLVESYRDFSGTVFHQRLAERFPMTELQARARKAKPAVPAAAGSD